MPTDAPENPASEAFGTAEPPHHSSAGPRRASAWRNRLKYFWDELLSEQTSNEQLDALERNGGPPRLPSGAIRRGWPYTPARRWRKPKPR
jgi:hypothetical protein